MGDIVEYKADPLIPNMAFEGEDEVFDAAVSAECPEAGRVAVHVSREGADGPVSSVYLTPAQAYLLAERVKTAAWVAEKLDGS